MSNIQKRSVKMDIIRIFALYTVIGVHFFLHSDYYSSNINTLPMYVATIVRSFFMICVPLFIVLSGYLMKNKKLSGKYYIGIIKTLGIYVLASFANYFYKTLYIKENISIFGLGAGILNFTIATYSWYVEMYIGLFLLIPFINLIYNNLECKAHKIALIATMISLTALPNILNIWDIHSITFLITPSLSSNYVPLIPKWWSSFYPITYYFIGCYLREYGLNISKKKNTVLLIVSVLVNGLFNIYRCYPGNFIWGTWQTWGSLFNVINTILVFNLLLSIDDSKISACFNRPLNLMSNLTFGAYLMSWVFDDFFYAKLRAIIPGTSTRFIYFPIMTLLTFVCSFAASFVLNVIYNICYKAFIKCFAKKSA